jgi:hypothetical protein
LICLDINRHTTSLTSLTLKQIGANVHSFFSGGLIARKIAPLQAL